MLSFELGSHGARPPSKDILTFFTWSFLGAVITPLNCPFLDFSGGLVGFGRGLVGD